MTLRKWQLAGITESFRNRRFFIRRCGREVFAPKLGQSAFSICFGDSFAGASINQRELLSPLQDGFFGDLAGWLSMPEDAARGVRSIFCFHYYPFGGFFVFRAHSCRNRRACKDGQRS